MIKDAEEIPKAGAGEINYKRVNYYINTTRGIAMQIMYYKSIVQTKVRVIYHSIPRH